jgi:hypothetical protein
LIERLFTEGMADYPNVWSGDKSGGCIAKYCEWDGFVLHGPNKGDYVFKANTENSLAFEVTYTNEKTRRIRVRETRLQVAYNEVLRTHLKDSPNILPHPSDSKVFLVERE